MEEELEMIMKNIVDSIHEAGYEPYDQLTAYLLTRDDRYITRNGNARCQIKLLEWGILYKFVQRLRGNGTA